MGQPISREEFTAFSERLYETMDAGFLGVHNRLDTLNGRMGMSERDRADLRAKLEQVQEVVLRRRQTDVPAPAVFTRREKALVGLGVGLVAALFKVALLMGEFAVALGKAAIHK